MKRIHPYALIAIAAILFSFAPDFGGENFEIYVNQKLVIQQHAGSNSSAPSLELNNEAAGGKIQVFYNHCGQVGKSRRIAIKNDANKTLREWSFIDSSDRSDRMSINTDDIIALFDNRTTKLQLVYSAKEKMYGNGQLASITLAKDVKPVKVKAE